MDLAFWSRPLSALLSDLDAAAGGLAERDAAARLRVIGPNIVQPRQRRSLLFEFFARFRNLLLVVLHAASAIFAFVGDLTRMPMQ